MRLFAQKQAPDFTPCGNRTKGRSPTESRNGSALCGRSRPRRRDARAARFTQALHDALSEERQRRLRPLRGIYEAVCPLPRPESRSRLGASAGQGAPAEAISRRMSYHVHTYIRSRAGCSIARYAYTLADGTDPLPKLLMLNCASARISCIDFDCSARRASQNEAKALCCARAHIRSDADGPPDR